MEKLVSKIQYKNFEPGEFVDERPRTPAEVIEVIESMPWEKERDHIQIDITTTSVTLQTDATDYLKLALYYNGRFVLYFFDGKELFSKSLATYKEAFPIIIDYFNNTSVDIALFKREHLLFKHVNQHFISKDFVYTASPASIKAFLLRTSGMSFILSIFLMAIFLKYLTVPAFVGTLILIFLLGGGLNLIFFFNYYHYVKNKLLKISKGQDAFYYGDYNNLIQYSRTDILTIVNITTRLNGRGSNRPFMGFNIYKIYFNNSIPSVAFNSLLIDELDFLQKFNRNIIKEQQRLFPIMNNLDME